MVYVDDIMIFSKTYERTDIVVKMLKERYQLTDNGELTDFLQMQFDVKDGEVKMNQGKYILDKVKEFKQEDGHMFATPMSTTTKFEELESPTPRD